DQGIPRRPPQQSAAGVPIHGLRFQDCTECPLSIMRAMSEFRFNQVTGDWVIIASERAKRPEDYIIRVNRRDMPPYVDTCPFCVGNEDMTDPIFSEPADGSWAVRVVRNKLPALQPGNHHEISGGLMDRRMT